RCNRYFAEYPERAIRDRRRGPAYLVARGTFASSLAIGFKSSCRWASSLASASCLLKIVRFSRRTNSSMTSSLQESSAQGRGQRAREARRDRSRRERSDVKCRRAGRYPRWAHAFVAAGQRGHWMQATDHRCGNIVPACDAPRRAGGSRHGTRRTMPIRDGDEKQHAPRVGDLLVKIAHSGKILSRVPLSLDTFVDHAAAPGTNRA